MRTTWKATSEAKDVFEARDGNRSARMDRYPSRSGDRLECRTARPRRGLWQCGRAREFVEDFVAAWNKVMNLDRYDIARSSATT
jgi:catalase-peroxidase